MTVSYTDEVTNGEGIQVCFNVLKRWRGSVYKLVWLDLVFYVLFYYILSLSYRYAMNEAQKSMFEAFAEFCAKSLPDIPISFLLGFYVSGIVSRWLVAYTCIPWLNRPALSVAAHIDGKDANQSRKIRLTLMRYLNLSWILMMRTISDQSAMRFRGQDQTREDTGRGTTMWRRTRHPRLRRGNYQPWTIQADTNLMTTRHPATPTASHGSAGVGVTPTTGQHAGTCETPCPTQYFAFDGFQAGDDNELSNLLHAMNNDKQVQRTYGLIISEAEITAFQNISSDWYLRTKTKCIPEYWIPIQWAQRLTLKALQGGYITQPRRAYNLLKELLRFRRRLQYLHLYSSLIIPLAYSQVVTIAMHSYVLCQLFARQVIEHHGHVDSGMESNFPVADMLLFLFIMGWFKVALCVLNPFGDDDEDFEINGILDYNLEVSYRMAYLSESSFPQNLSAPIDTEKNNAADEELDRFLRNIDEEIEKASPKPKVDEPTVI